METDSFRIYLDQMFNEEVARALRKANHYVLRASEIGQARANDEQILQKAITKNLILVTLDEHFGDWIVLPLSRHPGVVRIKVHPTTSKRIIEMLLPFLRKHKPNQLKDHLVILSQKHEKWIFTG